MLAGVLVVAALPHAAATPDATSLDYRQLLERIERESISEEEIAKLIEIAELLKTRAKAQLTLRQRIERAILRPWVVFGFLAQFAFMLRFVVQLIASERKKRSYVPVAFWYLSLTGGTMLFIYALRLRDPVFVLGQGLGCLIYIRNLILIHRRKEAHRDLCEVRRERVVQNEPKGGSEEPAPDPAAPAQPQTRSEG